MQCVPLTGAEAVRATLEAKLSIALSRAKYGRTKAQREEQALAAARYAEQLAAIDN